MNVDELRGQHDRIEALAAALRQAVDGHEAPQPVAAIRWHLARQLLAHLAVEDRLFYPSMMRSADADAAKTATAFRAEMGRFSGDFTAYMARWSEGRIARDWPGFCDETREILTGLEDRIRRENAALYPLAMAPARAA